MVGGRESGRTGQGGEEQIRAALASLKFEIFYSMKDFERATTRIMPRRYAIKGLRYQSRMRPNTRCQMDWGVFAEPYKLDLHIECKMQTSGGSVAAKAIAATLEMAHAVEPCNYFLVLPPESYKFRPCDKDYFRFARRICDFSLTLAHPDGSAWSQINPVRAGDISEATAYLMERYHERQKIEYAKRLRQPKLPVS